MLDDPVTKQGPVLHQTKHQVVPPVFACSEGLLVSLVNFSARRTRRKWACDGHDVAPGVMVSAVAVAIALSWLMAAPAAAAKSAHRSLPTAAEAAAKLADGVAKVPLPQPRPADAPARAAAKGEDAAPRDAASAGPKVDAQAPPPPSACRLALTEEVAIAPSIPPIKGPGGCGGEDLVRLEAVVLPDKRRVALTPAATMRCPMATAVVNWVRNDVAPLAERLGSAVTALDNFDSYQCRGRNNVSGAQLSEHGRANALDVHGFKLADGRMIDLTDRNQPRDLRESVLHAVCTHFSTVLGPDSDWYHEDHIHLDLIERRNNYRICQWDVLDPLPKVAPLMPAARPDDAPSRETAQAGTENVRKTASTDAEHNSSGRAGTDEKAEPPATAQSPSADDRSGRADTEAQPPAAKPAGTVRNRQTASKSAPEQQKSGRVAAETRAPTVASDKARNTAGRDQRALNSSSGERASPSKPAPRKRHHGRRGWDPFRGLF
ncbi:extensin family protein [Bradyrhizobium sp. SZCCHNRI1009]|uniref:extensin family protein n=1 Tax=Bradyrhizobium sp. SZCCHNRI1009 TaxID=3057277 RepID=UPI002915F9E2|nr:extensin family protein [Bradyrhizobium sp. SZCCHNRI1009]